MSKAKKNDKENNLDRKIEVIFTIIITIIIIFIMFIMCETDIIVDIRNWCNNNGYFEVFDSIISFTDSEMVEAYLTQLSLTFITVSVITVLSDKSRTVYWINLVEDKLIFPRFRCFFAYVIYTFSTLIINLFALIFKNNLFFICFFVIDVVIIGILTISMISLYFTNSKEKAEAISKFKKYSQINREECLIGLKEYTIRAIIEHDIETLNDNLEFYSNYCNAEDVSYIYSVLNATNLDFLQKLLTGFSKRFTCQYYNDINEIDEALEEYNLLNLMPDKLFHQLIKEKTTKEFKNIYESILIFSRDITIKYMDYFLCDLPTEEANSQINKSNIITYKEFRYAIRELIRKKKNEYKSEEDYDNGIYAAEIQCNQIKCINIDNMNKYFEERKVYNFEECIRKLPIRKVLEMVNCALDEKNFYFITVFVATYQQFPIFKYMYLMNVNYNNNSVYRDINTLIKDAINKSNGIYGSKDITKYKEPEEIEEPLNSDWRQLFLDIMK